MSDQTEIDNENARMDALHQYNILDTAAEEKFDYITQLASLICETPVSLLNFIDSKRQWSKAGAGIDPTLLELPRDIVFCNQTIKHDTLYEIPDTKQHPIFKDNPLVNGNYKVRFYAGVPLINPEGFRLGALCVLDMKPKLLTESQKESLYALGKLAVSILESKRIKENLDLLVQVNDSIDCHVMIFDSKSWKCKFANIQALSISKYSDSEIINLGFHELFTDLKQSDLHKIVDSIVNNEIPYFNINTMLKNKNNDSIPIQLFISIRNIINSSELVVAFLYKVAVRDSKIDSESNLLARQKFKYDVTDEVSQQKISSKSATEDTIRSALANSEFMMYYQPIINAVTGKITSCEALLRWKDANGNISLPQNFIKIAEESNLIVELGERVFREVSNQIAVWKKRGIAIVPVAINISTHQIKQDDFVDMVESIINDDAVSSQEIILELTESAIVENYSLISSKMEILKNAGFRFSLDDFGTGYSSLSYLTRFPLDKIKIDKSFVSGITSNSTSSAIIKSVIALATNLKLSVIAEGVETQDQLAFLKKFLCDEIQGFLISKPICPADFENKFLSTIVD